MSAALDRARALTPEQVAALVVALDDAAIALREVLASSRIAGKPGLPLPTRNKPDARVPA